MLTLAVVFSIAAVAAGERRGFDVGDEREDAMSGYALAIHGGAGVIERGALDPEQEAAYRSALGEALAAGEAVLARDGSALDAVTAAVTVMEDSELFNAGRGAVFTHEGRNELDASIMDGAGLDAGAVAAVTRIRNPVLAARAVMERSVHVMLVGQGAEAFAREAGVELVDPAYFHTERRWQQLERARASGATLLDDDAEHRFGTVGAVARDRTGDLAAATSTGGMTNKRWGRVGDTPIIGAGTYAANDGCAVSATGHGEFFIRRTVARDICALVQYAGLGLAAAARRVIHDELAALGGDGGIIAVDAAGNLVWEMNTSGMYRARVRESGPPEVAIYVDAP